MNEAIESLQQAESQMTYAMALLIQNTEKNKEFKALINLRLKLQELMIRIEQPNTSESSSDSHHDPK